MSEEIKNYFVRLQHPNTAEAYVNSLATNTPPPSVVKDENGIDRTVMFLFPEGCSPNGKMLMAYAYMNTSATYEFNGETYERVEGEFQPILHEKSNVSNEDSIDKGDACSENKSTDSNLLSQMQQDEKSLVKDLSTRGPDKLSTSLQLDGSAPTSIESSGRLVIDTERSDKRPGNDRGSGPKTVDRKRKILPQSVVLSSPENSSSDSDIADANLKKKMKKNKSLSKEKQPNALKHMVKEDKPKEKMQEKKLKPWEKVKSESYALKDDKQIIKAILSKQSDKNISGMKYWEDLESQKVLGDRKASSMRLQFFHRIMPNLHQYVPKGETVKSFKKKINVIIEKSAAKKNVEVVQITDSEPNTSDASSNNDTSAAELEFKKKYTKGTKITKGRSQRQVSTLMVTPAKDHFSRKIQGQKSVQLLISNLDNNTPDVKDMCENVLRSLNIHAQHIKSMPKALY